MPRDDRDRQRSRIRRTAVHPGRHSSRLQVRAMSISLRFRVATVANRRLGTSDVDGLANIALLKVGPAWVLTLALCRCGTWAECFSKLADRDGEADLVGG